MILGTYHEVKKKPTGLSYSISKYLLYYYFYISEYIIHIEPNPKVSAYT